MTLTWKNMAKKGIDPRLLPFLILASDVRAQLGPGVISTPIRTIVCMLKDALVNIAGTLAALVFIIAAIKWIWSMDDPGKRKAAKDTMVHALIGLFIVAIADTIVSAIPGFTGC